MEIATTSFSSVHGPGCSCPACSGLGTSSSRYAHTTPRRLSPGEELSAEDHAMVRELATTDRNVRAHEQAHLSAAGGLAMGGASFQMVTGQDGQRYAVAGEVRIDVSPAHSPEETIRKARIIQAAALAPVDPSGADRAIAAQARAMEQQAQAELAQQTPGQRQLGATYRVEEDTPSSVFQAAA